MTKIQAKKLLTDTGCLPDRYQNKVYYIRQKVVEVYECCDDRVNIVLENGTTCFYASGTKELDYNE